MLNFMIILCILKSRKFVRKLTFAADILVHATHILVQTNFHAEQTGTVSNMKQLEYIKITVLRFPPMLSIYPGCKQIKLSLAFLPGQ